MLADRPARAAPAAVLASATLFRHIVSFQPGVALAVYTFWCSHPRNAHSVPPKASMWHWFVANAGQVAGFVAEHASVRLLDLISPDLYLPRQQYELQPGSLPRPIGRRVVPVTVYFGNVVNIAVSTKNAELLQWAIDHQYLNDGDAEVYMIHLIRNYTPGDLRILTVLQDQRSFLATVDPGFMEKEYLYHRLTDAAIVDWLYTYIPQLQWTPALIIDTALQHGLVHLLRALFHHHPHARWDGTVLLYSTHTPEHADCIHFLFREQPHAMVRADHVDIAEFVRRGSIEFLHAVHHSRLYRNDEIRAIQIAVERDDMDAIKRFEEVGFLSTSNQVPIHQYQTTDATLYLLEHHYALVTPATMDKAAADKRWDVVRYLHHNHTEGCTTQTMDAAAAQGLLDQVMWLHENRTEGCSTRALDEAAGCGHLEVVQYLHEVVKAPCSTAAVDNSAKDGHLEVVRYLHEVVKAPCTTAAVDNSAMEGFLEIVEYLLTHRSEGCTTAAMDNARCLAIVQVLHTHSTAGCTSAAVLNALTNNGADQTPLIAFLFEHYRHVFDATTLHLVLLRGHFEIWNEIRGLFPVEAEASLSSAMRVAGEEMELATINYIATELNRSDLGYLAMDGAMVARSCSLTHVVAVWKIAGPQSCRLSGVRGAVSLCPARVDDVPDQLKFVISACIEPNAKEFAMQIARECGLIRLEQLISAWTPKDPTLCTTHPILLDVRSSQWLCKEALKESNTADYEYRRCLRHTIPTLAVYKGDQEALEVIHRVSLTEEGARLSRLRFDGAREAAVRTGNLSMLQWLLSHVDTVPIEPVLLDEAIFYHRWEVALWLAVHCPAGCQSFEPEKKHRYGWYQDCGYDDVAKEWIESQEAVKQYVDFEALLWSTWSSIVPAPEVWQITMRHYFAKEEWQQPSF